MRSSTKKNLSLAAMLAALFAAGFLGTLTYDAWQRREASMRQDQVAAAPVPAPGAAAESDAEAVPPAPPGTEVVPPEESESDRGPASASPAGPTLSFGRAQGLHQTPDPLRLNSSAALVVDQASGEVLVRKNDQAVLPIASLTKLMTSLVVLEASQPKDEVLTITEEDVDNERHSRSRLRVGTTLTREEALQLALMSSENRAAHALGRTYPGGLPRMVEAMNAKAAQLGMKNSSFVDPTGLSNSNKSTARDLALLVRTAAQNPTIAAFSTTPQHVASLGGKSMQYINSNRLVRNHKAGWDIALQKTGYIVEAGRCLTMSTEVAGRHLIMVLLDSESNGTRLSDAEKLRRFAVAQIGGPEALAALDAEKSAARKAAARKERNETRHAASEKKQKKVVAGKDDDDDDAKKSAASRGKDGGKKKKTVVADRKDGDKDSGKKASARSSERKKDRVKQTFAAGKESTKS
ncbi:MAG TPA: serine hydrolase [Ramlibacter sp.]|uniref:D-alanyl-D-alanine carboxypeptidase family protein n=1 Tax=Ramlibacter sp. TaxID=1917967 RepID=UPI002ED67CE5